jgi:hypothetical protein
MPRDPHLQQDLEIILDQVRGCTLLDELTLLRAAIRYYAEGHGASDSVAWAANELSAAITKKPIT